MTDKSQSGRPSDTSFNPTTGRAWSLNDPEMRERVAALKDRLRDPAQAKKFLSDAGIATAAGRLTKRYGG